jgi:hypothetical protein
VFVRLQRRFEPSRLCTERVMEVGKCLMGPATCGPSRRSFSETYHWWRACAREELPRLVPDDHQVVWPPSPPPDAVFPPIYSPQRENPNPDQFSKKYTASRRHRQCKIGRVQKLFLAPCQRGELPPEAFFITMPASRVMCE